VVGHGSIAVIRKVETRRRYTHCRENALRRDVHNPIRNACLSSYLDVLVVFQASQTIGIKTPSYMAAGCY
jgi:hypothetical protein